MHGYTDAKDDYLKRLRRVEGQVRGIARMVDEDVYCIDVLTQIAAVTKALQAVSIGLVEDHLGALRRRRRPPVPRGGRGEGHARRPTPSPASSAAEPRPPSTPTRTDGPTTGRRRPARPARATARTGPPRSRAPP